MNLGETNSHFVAYMRAMKATRLGSLIHRKNPFDILFKADVGQTNFWRKAVWYSKARRLSYRRMNYNMDRSYKLIDRLSAGLLTKGPERFAQEYAKAGPELEQAAKHVSDFLGDYVNYTPSERLFLSRHLMFYGWLRHSLRFMFYTMPIGHPIMTAILSDIGRLGANEIKDLLGVPRSHGLPLSVSSLLYLGNRHDAQTGNLRTLPVNRLNPFLNAISQLDNNQQVLGMVSPAVQMAADQMFEESSFTGKDWRVRGEYTPAESQREAGYYDKGMARERIALRQVLNLAFPYRVWERAALEPSQSDDALAWSPRPLHPKEAQAKRGIALARRQFHREGPLTAIRNEVFPFPLPGAGLGAKRTAAPEFLKRELEKEAAAANKARGRRKTRRRSRRGGSSQFSGGGGSFGGGSQFGG
jgi:uncharacterized membrane protein YgcG